LHHRAVRAGGPRFDLRGAAPAAHSLSTSTHRRTGTVPAAEAPQPRERERAARGPPSRTIRTDCPRTCSGRRRLTRLDGEALAAAAGALLLGIDQLEAGLQQRVLVLDDGAHQVDVALGIDEQPHAGALEDAILLARLLVPVERVLQPG